MAARVLVVDDDNAVRTMLVTVLEAMGYDACGASDGADAFAVLGRWRPDVILLDLLMPVMNGLQFLEHRAPSANLAAIPVIVLTVATTDVPTAEQLRVRAVLPKPHAVGLLRTLIEQSVRDAATDD